MSNRRRLPIIWSRKENYRLLLYEKPAQEMKNLINLRKTCKNASNET
jgi:hypothetical protein